MNGLFDSKNRFWLAPMAGITDSAFRSACAGFGAGLCYTEMISAKALVYKNQRTRQLLAIGDDQRPCFVQIFGSEPDFCAEGARIAIDIARPDGIDINMGCPVGKVVSNGEGCALMADPVLAGKIVEAVKKAAGALPVTVKTRLGFQETRDPVAFAKTLESAGADAVCIHGRTREQLYSGKADWQAVGQVKQALSVPVILSGDVFSAQDAVRALEQTGCDAVLVARGALGRPWIFEDCLRVEREEAPRDIDATFIVSTMLAHIGRMCQLQGEKLAMPQARKHALWYLGNLRGAKPYKAEAAQVGTYRELEGLCERVSGLSVR